MGRKSLGVYFDDFAAVRPYRDRIVFIFEQKGAKSMRGHAVDPSLAVRISVEAICLASFLDCMQECKEECREEGLDVECKHALRDCLVNPDAFAEHALRMFARSAQRGV